MRSPHGDFSSSLKGTGFRRNGGIQESLDNVIGLMQTMIEGTTAMSTFVSPGSKARGLKVGIPDIRQERLSLGSKHIL